MLAILLMACISLFHGVTNLPSKLYPRVLLDRSKDQLMETDTLGSLLTDSLNSWR